MPTINDQGIARGSIREAEQGDWFGEVFTNSEERIPDGARVTIVVQNVTLSGAVVRGGITEAVGRYQVCGRPEWGLPVAPKGYQSQASVLQNTVLADLCRDIFGPSFVNVVELPAQKNLGRHFERFGPTARDVVAKMGLPWYVRGDGKTIFATRQSGTVTTNERVLVSYRNNANGLRVVNCEDIAAFVPGLTFEGETIGEVTLAITAEDVSMHLWPRASSSVFATTLRDVFRRVFPRVDLSGTYEYVAKGPRLDGGWDLVPYLRTDLPPIGMPDLAPFVWTIAGHSAQLAPLTHVLVIFADGDPSRPKVVGIDPSALPTTSTFGAATSLDIDAASVNLGDAFAPVVRYGDTITLAVPGGPPTPVPIATAVLILSTSLLDPPTVIPTKVKA
jgi:hypothetical protein